MCACVYVWVFELGFLFMCGFCGCGLCNMWVCVCVDFLMCACVHVLNIDISVYVMLWFWVMQFLGVLKFEVWNVSVYV